MSCVMCVCVCVCVCERERERERERKTLEVGDCTLQFVAQEYLTNTRRRQHPAVLVELFLG